MVNFSIDTRFLPDRADLARQLLDLTRWSTTRMRRKVTKPEALRVTSRRAVSVVRRAAKEYARRASRIAATPITFEIADRMMLWRRGEEAIWYPWAPEKMFFFGFLSAFGHAAWLEAKYTLPGVVTLDDADTVVDCGSFVGGFALAAPRTAVVHAVEPSRANSEALRRNVVERPNVTHHAVGLGEHDASMYFTESTTGVDSSFGALDEGVAAHSYRVDVRRLDTFLADLDPRATFLKLEAEGLELPILRSLGSARISKIAIDASPENGTDDKQSLRVLLQSLGYVVHQDANMIYGRMPNGTP